MARIGLAGAAIVSAGLGLAPQGAIAQAQVVVPIAINPHLLPVSPPAAAGAWVPPEQAVPEGISVASRPRTDFVPIGGRMGTFFLYPQLTLSDRYTDNLRASDTNKFGDNAIDLAAGAQIVSGFSRHALRAGGWYERSFHPSHTSENASEYGGTVVGQIDLPSTRIDLGSTVERGLVAREDFISDPTTLSPLAYNATRGNIAVTHRFNRLSVAASGNIARLSYLDVVTDAGVRIDERFRDYTGYTGALDVSYEVQPGLRAFARGTYTRIAYRLGANDPGQLGGLNRDSRGWSVQSGVRLDVSRIIYGEIWAGYLSRKYDDARLLDTQGLSFGADLLWNVTGITSVRLGAARRIDEAPSLLAAGNRVTEFKASIEQELQRNLLVTLGGGHSHYQPLGPLAATNDWRAELAARYLISRRYSMNLKLRHDVRNSPDVIRSFTENSIQLGIALTL